MKITRQQMTKIFELCEADPQVAYLEWLRYADPKDQLKDALKNYIKEQTKMACLEERYVKMSDEDSEVIASYCYCGGPLTNEKIAVKFLSFVGKYLSRIGYWELELEEIDLEELCELYYDFFAAKDTMFQEALDSTRSVLKEKARQVNRQYLNTKGVHHE